VPSERETKCSPARETVMDELSLLLEFEDCGDSVEMPEDTTAARVAIYAGDDCLTRNAPRRPRLCDASDTVFGPVAGLVDWLIENWTPLLWETHTPFPKGMIGAPNSKRPAIPGLTEAFENWSRYRDSDNTYLQMPSEEADVAAFADWQHRHQLGHGSSDLAIPSIVILPEDRQVVVSVDRLPGRMQSSVDFLGPHGMHRAPSLFVFNKTSFRQEVKDFIESTLNRARSRPEFDYWASWLTDRWQTAQEDEENLGRRLFWMLGSLGGNRVEELRLEDARLSDGLRQLLLDCKFVTRMNELPPVEGMIGEYALKPDAVLSRGEEPGWQTVAQDTISPLLPEFAQGYQLARMLRRKLSLGDKPVADITKTFKRLDVEIEENIPSPLFRVAVCAAKGKRAHIVPSSLDARIATDSGNRFACTTALGRLLWQSRNDSRSAICAAQGDHSMLTQTRRANAFAAEFLIPREAVAGTSTDDLQAIGLLSERYGISQSAARWHAHNVSHDPEDYWT
jgi:hypothetical protein